MASAFSKVMMLANSNPANSFIDRHLPMINTVMANVSPYVKGANQIRKKKGMMSWYKGLPELTALTNKVARDIVKEWHFEPVSSAMSGRNKLLKANAFAQEIGLRKVMLSQVIDILVTGEGFGWMGKISDEVLRKELNILVNKRKGLELKEKVSMFDSVYNELKFSDNFQTNPNMDEDILRPRKYRSVPSSTMEVLYDNYDILGYVQDVGLRKVEFTKEEIVRFTFIDLDGRVEGFTPVESILVQLELLRQMWQNMLSIHKNGGMPDKVISFEDVQPNSPSFNRIVEQFKKYRQAENRHGMYLMTGKMKIEDLQQLDKMQFMDSGLYITGLIAMQWQIPRSSIPYIVKDSNTKEDLGSNAERSYWQNVQFSQRVYADVMNTQLWIPHFGVKLVFDNKFLQQDMQYHTARMQKLNNLMTEERMLSMVGMKLNKDTVLNELERSSIEVEEGMVDQMLLVGQGMGTQAQQSEQDVNDSSGRANRRDRKKDEQTASIAKRPTSPSGVGK